MSGIEPVLYNTMQYGSHKVTSVDATTSNNDIEDEDPSDIDMDGENREGEKNNSNNNDGDLSTFEMEISNESVEANNSSPALWYKSNTTGCSIRFDGHVRHMTRRMEL